MLIDMRAKARGGIKMKEKTDRKHPIRMYLELNFFICYGLGILEFVTRTGKFQSPGYFQR